MTTAEASVEAPDRRLVRYAEALGIPDVRDFVRAGLLAGTSLETWCERAVREVRRAVARIESTDGEERTDAIQQARRAVGALSALLEDAA